MTPRRILAAIEQARAGDDIGRLRAKLLEYQQKSKFYPALRVAKKLLSHHEKHKGKDHDDTLRALQDVGRLYWTIGDYVQAIGLTEEAVRRLEAKKGPHHMETLFARDMLAAVYWAKQDFARADAVYQNVLVGYAPDVAHQRDRGVEAGTLRLEAADDAVQAAHGAGAPMR